MKFIDSECSASTALHLSGKPLARIIIKGPYADSDDVNMSEA